MFLKINVLVLSILLFNSSFIFDHGVVVELVDVHDGDTFTVNIPEWHPVVGSRMPIRISGIDTPEINDMRPEFKEKAIEARNFLRQHLNSEIKLYNLKRDKYFRINANVVVDGVSIGPLMIRNGLAKPYDGKKKQIWN